VSVSISGYFLSFLRGKEPKVTDVFACFSGLYPHYLGGMVYKLVWTVVWGLMAFAAPFVLYSVGLRIIGYFAVALGFYQIHFMIGLIVLCIIWFVVFMFLFFNRIAAYSLTGVAIAAQPRLPAHRAVRLSRKLMRGYKWQQSALFLSFIPFYVPLLIAGALLLLLPGVAPLFGIAESTVGMIRIGLYALAAVNLLITAYVAPYVAACFRAFYIERKREALMDDEVSQLDFVAMPKPRKKTAEKAIESAKDEASEPAAESGPIDSLPGLFTPTAQKDDVDD